MTRRSRLAVLSCLLATLPASTAGAATPADRAAGYLERSLHDGCSIEGGGVNVGVTAWAAIGLGATRRPAARAAAGCVVAHRASLRSATELELGILALSAAHRDPRHVAGRDLVRELLRQRHGGRIGPITASTMFGVLALRAARVPVPPAVVRTLLRLQEPDGGYAAYPGSQSDSNLTAAGIEAMRSVGIGRRARPVRRALAALARFRRPDGGYTLFPGGASDSQSTAWAVQGLTAAGRPTLAARRYLVRMQRADGSVRYSRSSNQAPVWVTAYAAAALVARPLPIR